MARIILTVALALCAPLLPQHASAWRAAPARTLQQELQQLGAQAAELNHALPSFTCQETVVSQRLHGRKVLQQSGFTATLRVKRLEDGSLVESFHVTSLNGKPFPGGSFDLPLYVSGGFDRAMLYFAPALQSCYRYSLSLDHIDFESADGAEGNPSCEYGGLHGFALLDADGNVTHLERRISPEAATRGHMAFFAAIDFAPVELNGHTFRLSRHLLSETPRGKQTGRFDATYTGCQFFTATVTVGPATETEPAPQLP